MKAKIKKLREEAILPEKAHDSDVGYDLYAVDYELKVEDYGVGSEHVQVKLYTGISVTPPEGYYFEIMPRSSVSKTPLMLANSVGIVDPEYTGELIVKLNFVSSFKHDHYGVLGRYHDYLQNFLDPKKGKLWKCAQLVLRKKESCEWEVVDNLGETQRGDGGFGSTGQS